MTSLLAHYLETATPEEKTKIRTQLRSAITRGGNDAYAGLSSKWDDIANAWFADIVKAEKSGNAQEVWQAWGEANGNFITNVALQVLVTIVGIGHGVVLYPIYMVLCFQFAMKARLHVGFVILMLLAGFVPGLAFYMEHKMERRLFPRGYARR